MTVLDLGCGPGFFSIAMAQMTGASGRVIAVDLQSGMLQKLNAKIQGTELESAIFPGSDFLIMLPLSAIKPV
jgi:ubiquinone/menaquinone biosynthesis C-methylase UbiE